MRTAVAVRRTALALTALATTLLGPAAVASAAETAPGWEPAPSPPFDLAAGVRCDFPVHGEPLVDEVVGRIVERHPDGSPKRVAYKGDLVVRVTHTGTGDLYDADVSGTALVDHRTDGSQFWSVLGPVLVGVGEGGGNMPRSLYVVDGLYTMDISATGHKTVTMVHGTRTDICEQID